MFVKNIFIIGVLFLSITTINAQHTKSIYLETLGSGLFYSINTDFRFTKTTKFGSRLGVALYPENTVILPIQVNYLLGEGKHKLEIGAGITINFGDETEVAENLVVMYRFQGGNGILFRAGWAPTFIHTSESNAYRDIRKIFWVWPGMSIGYSF